MIFRLAAAALSLLVLAVAPAARAAVTVERLRCEYAENPLGLEVARPRLFWQLRSAGRGERGQRQTAYQVIVASSDANLVAGRGDLWDSGKVASDQSVHVVYAGRPLGSGQRAYWKVRVWDKDGRETGFSRPAFFEMGLPVPSDWQGVRWIGAATNADDPATASFLGARWIWTNEDSPAVGERFFRRIVTLPDNAKITRATLRLTVDDQFTLFVNNAEIGKSGGQTDSWRTPQTFDLTNVLRPGANTLRIRATNSGGGAGVLARLVVTFGGQAATPLVVVSDAAWQASATGDAATGKPAREVAALGAGPWGALDVSVGAGRYLRRAFVVAKPVKSARLYASALGVYEPYLNGRRVGNDVFAPGWTDYKKRVQYQTYDVTRLLNVGPNAVGILLGDGWYAGHVGLAGRNIYGTQPAACVKLVVEYADGTRDALVSDGSWRTSTAGPVVASDLIMGETYDARHEIKDWSAAGFDDARWRPAVLHEDKNTPPQREAQRGPAVRVQQELAARRLTQPAPGVFVFDLGQNMVGWARLKVRGSAGAKVTLRFAEMLNPDGTIYTANYRGARCTDEYILKGDRRGETWEPHFTFRGFRYVAVTGYPSTPSKDAITGIVVHSDTPRVGTMTTSSPMVNQLLANIDWGQRGNFLSVPTDCPQRDERLGWMGDAQIFIRTATYNRDVAGFFNKWLVDVDDAQSPAGAFADVSPRINVVGEGVAAWGDAGVICPWTVYQTYGEVRVLEEHYPAMTKWVAWCEANSKNLLRPASGYGDWLSIAADTPKDVLATAYFAYSTHLVAEAARALGKTDDAKKYDDLFARIKTAFNAAYVAPDARIQGNTQTGYVLALRFNLLPENKREAAARYLVSDIQAKGNHLSTGFVGVGYLCPTLTETGHADVAYKLLLNDTFPSWGYSIKHGATTIWERWDGWTEEKGFQDAGMNSFNHYSLGSVGEWLYSSVAGIDLDPAAPGFKRIVVRPRPGAGLDHVRAEYETLYGRVVSAWSRQPGGGALTLNVSVPANATATVYVPAPTGAASVTEGGRPAQQSSGLRFLREEDGCAVYAAESGDYHFAVRAR